VVPGSLGLGVNHLLPRDNLALSFRCPFHQRIFVYKFESRVNFVKGSSQDVERDSPASSEHLSLCQRFSGLTLPIRQFSRTKVCSESFQHRKTRTKRVKDLSMSAALSKSEPVFRLDPVLPAHPTTMVPAAATQASALMGPQAVLQMFAYLTAMQLLHVDSMQLRVRETVL
jgi:hypothetical protein